MKSRLFQITVAVLAICASMSAQKVMAESISGVITNSGSNNGGQPNFTCSEIKVYVAQRISTVPLQYKQIGASVAATGNISNGCKYTLTVPAEAIGKFVDVLTNSISPTKWTTTVNVIDISPNNFSNPIQIKKNENLTNRNLTIRATVSK